MAKVLILDDERDLCELIEMGLMAQGVACTSVYTVKNAIKALKNEQFDLIFSDIRLPDGDGLDFLAYVQKHSPNTPVCVMTAHGSMDMAIRALQLGAFDFVNKPFELKQLRAIVQAGLKKGSETGADKSTKSVSKSRTSKDKETGRSAKSEVAREAVVLIGEAPVMQRVRQLIEKVSKSQAPVFIHGESGTGKEVVARMIHERSRRADGPFVAVNCGAIPENLVESEFFGYKKGAFTGANQDTDGLFVSANGGTLFLDEIADLPLSMQVKLLRAIQERAVRPIGGDVEEMVDVRIVSATHYDLAECVRDGRFREDLFYRLNVIELVMPPLREREGDIALLSEFLLDKLSKEAGYPAVSLSDEALAKLEAHRFSGNVRELGNVLERALTFIDGEVIAAEDIQFASASVEMPVVDNMSVQEVTSTELREREEEKSVEDLPDDFEEYMQNIEKDVLIRALEENHYNKTRAAERLGISFRTMRYKLKKLGID